MSSLFQAYLHQLRVNTLKTQMATSAVGMGLGDVLTQQAVLRNGLDHDWKSTLRFVIFGGLLWAPVSNRWHWLLSRINLSTSSRTLLVRYAIDLPVFSPLSTAWFFLWMPILERRSYDDARKRAEQNFVPVVCRQWLVYGPAQALNLTLIPLQARPPFLNVVGLLWTSYLASVNAKLNESGTADQIRQAEIDRIAATVME